MSSRITLKICPTVRDYTKAWRVGNFRSSLWWAPWFLFGLFVAALFAVRIMKILDGFSEWTSITAVMPPLAIYLYAVWGFFVWRPNRYARGASHLGVESEVAVSDVGISSNNNLLTHEFRWTAFNRAVERRDFFLLYSGEARLFPFPKRFFDNTEDMDRFRELVRAHVPNFSGQ